ncbi:transposase zinc-binding domain-containing protein, partial [Desulfocicer niacini]
MYLPTDLRPSSCSIEAQNVEVSDIFRRHINDYQARYKLHPEHYKVASDIMECRTPYLGGHIHACSDCGHEIELYNSCGNRHCPKCQTVAKARWLENRKAELLPVPY